MFSKVIKTNLMKNLFHFILYLFFLLNTSTEGQIPKPSDTFGFEVGADYKLADYDQMLTYYEVLAASTDRVQMIEIGKSVMGRPLSYYLFPVKRI